MPGKDDFDSLFDDKESEISQPSQANDDLFSFDEMEAEVGFDDFEEDTSNPVMEEEDGEEEPIDTLNADETISLQGGKKRSSEDFEPDMDALLLTAQSPMIIEAMKYLTLKDYSVKTLATYSEAVKGVDLYIKIIQRNPNNFYKLSSALQNDIDCKEVQKIAFNLYKTKYSDIPQTDAQRINAFEILKEKLMGCYQKALVSRSISDIKKYFLLSGGLDIEKIKSLIKINNIDFKTIIAKLNQNIKLATEILKSKDPEIAKGLKGRDVNIFIIKTSQLLATYYNLIKNNEAKEYFQRLHNTYKKYFVIRE